MCRVVFKIYSHSAMCLYEVIVVMLTVLSSKSFTLLVLHSKESFICLSCEVIFNFSGVFFFLVSDVNLLDFNVKCSFNRGEGCHIKRNVECIISNFLFFVAQIKVRSKWTLFL